MDLPTDADALAARLQDAVDARTVVPLLSASWPELTLEGAYAIQRAYVARRLAGGDRIIGMKLGLTSKAKQRTMGLHQPVFGTLLGSSLIPMGDPVPIDELIHPRVEPEIVFRIGFRLAGPGVTVVDVLEGTDAVAAGFEIIDSRYADFKFTMPDVVADNTSAARFILGSRWVSPREIPDMSLIGVALEVDGEQITTAAGAAILGHPAGAVALLANWMGNRGEALLPGHLVLSGGITDAVPLLPGRTVTAVYGRLGSITVRGATEIETVA